VSRCPFLLSDLEGAGGWHPVPHADEVKIRKNARGGLKEKDFSLNEVGKEKERKGIIINLDGCREGLGLRDGEKTALSG